MENFENFKLDPISIKYNINEEKKVVTCISEYSIGNLHNNLTTGHCSLELSKAIKLFGNNSIRKSSFIRFTVIGIARCNPEDIFDIELGKKIAESRASIKAFKFYSEYIRQCSLNINRLYTHLDSISDKYKSIATKEEGHLKFLLGK